MTLSANEGLTLSSAGGNYSFISNQTFVNGGVSQVADFSAFSSSTLSLNDLAQYSAINIFDADANASVTFANSGSNSFASGIAVVLDHPAAGSIVFEGTTALSGSNYLSVSTSRNIEVHSGASVSTFDGSLSLLANQQLTPTAGSFVGVQISNSQVKSTGVGSVTVKGRGGTSSANLNHGVFLESSGSLITSQGGAIAVDGAGGGNGTSVSNHGVFVEGTIFNASASGTVTVRGIGGNTTGSDSDSNIGVFVPRADARISSNGGAVAIEGTAGGAGSGIGNFGVQLGGTISSSGTSTSSTVTVTGTGGRTSGYTNHGVVLSAPAAHITSSAGAVLVVGTGGGVGASTSNHGVYFDAVGVIDSSGPLATVTVRGFGGNTTGTGGFNDGVVVVGPASHISSSGGSVSVEGYGGGAGASTDNIGVLVVNGAAITSEGTAAPVNVMGGGGNISGSGGRNFGVSLIAAAAQISSAGGAIAVTGTSGSGATSSAVRTELGGKFIGVASAVITVTADSIEFLSSTSIDAGNSPVVLRPKTAAFAIDLGGADVLAGSGSGALGLTDGELGSVVAGTVQIGDSGTGAIVVSAQLTSVNDLTLVTSAQLTSSQGILMALNKSLVVNAGGTISLPSSTSDLIASGTGSISLTTTRNISLGLFASITTASGDLSLSANQQVAPSTGSFVGIEIIGGTINVGNGNLSIKGRGGDNSSNNYGVFVRGSQGQVMSTGGAILVEGRAGGSGGGNSNFGVYLLSGAGISSAGSMSTATVTVKGYGGNFNGNGGSNNGVVVEQSDAFIRSNGGALLVEGTGGGGGGSGNNYGVHAMGGVIESTAAAVTVKGYGGNLSGAVGSDNYGVLVRGSSGLISAFSSVVVQGTGGGTGNSFNNFGVYLLSGGTITSTGTVASSTVAVSGNGGNSTGAGNTNFGVFIENSAATVSSSGGAIEITGISGSGATSPAISLQNTGRILGTSANAMVTLVGDSMDFLPSTSINAGSNFVTLKPRTAGTLINLGGDDGLIGSPLVLGLTDAAIDRVTAGTLQIGVPSSGTINVTSAISYEGNLTLVTGGGLSGSAGLTTGSATATTLRVQQTGNSTYTGVLGGNTTNANNFRLIKEGAGSLILTAAHTYAGNTLVNAGELRINGSLADTSETLAQTGGTVGGTGVLNNLLNASSLSTISPGNGMIGTLTVNHSALSGLQMGSPSQLNIELGGIASYDKLIVNGTISLSAGATLNLSSFNGYAPAPNSTFVFVVNDSSDPIVGTFVAGAGSSLVPGTVLTEGTLVSSNFLGSGLPAYITYLGGDGNDAAITLAGGQIEITSGATASIPENSVAAAYTIHAEFLGPGGTIAYGISGVDAARFQVNGSSGAITFVAPPNFENPVDSGFNNTYDIVVVASAGQLTATKPVVITVTDVNESPMIAAQTFSIPESVSIVVNGTFEYPHTNPANGLPFGWQRTGSVEVIGEDSTSGAGPAFDGEQFVDLNGEGTGGVSQVLATVPGHSYSLTFSYANNYVWTSPSNPATALVSIRNNSTDLVPAFSISHGSSNSLGLNWTLHAVNFTAAGSSTTLQFLSTIPIGDGGIYIDGVSVVDQTMGTVNGSVVGTVSSSDVDISDTKTFAITGGNSSNAFAIHPTTGLLTVTNGSLLNFEERPTYVLMVSVTDAGGLTATNNVTINVTNLNEAPIVASQSFSIAENSPNGTLVGTVLAFDMDQADSRTFAITAGNLTGAFTITANTGAIRVADSVLLDYESVSSFALTVRVTDSGGLSSTSVVTVLLTDVRYDPALLNVTSFSLNPVLAAAGVVATPHFSAAGSVVMDISAGTTFSTTPGGLSLGAFTAVVPATAGYRTKGTLNLGNVAVNGGALTAVGDDGVLVVAYFGDVTGNGTYTGQDASYLARVSVGIDNGFEQFKLLDPNLIGDITGNGDITAQDVSYAMRTAVGISVAEVPAPLPTVSLVQGGPDPKLSVPQTLAASPGESLVIPVDIDSIVNLTGNGLMSADLVIYFDPSVLEITEVALGSLIASRGWSISSQINPLAGRIDLSLAGTSPIEGVFRGQLVQLHANVKSDARSGSFAINLAASSRYRTTQLNEGFLTLIPAPTDDPNDPIDGRLTVQSREPGGSQQGQARLSGDHLLITGTDGDDSIIVGQLLDGRFRVRLGRQHLGDFVAAGVAIDSLRGEDFVYASPFASAVVVTGELTESDHVFGGENTQIVNSQTPEVSQQGASSGTLNDSALLQLISNWSNEFSDINPNGHSSRTGLSRRR